MLDLLIRNGSVLDGTGCAAFPAHIGIKDGKIAYIGRELPESAAEIDAAGKTVTPGFIDIHRHADAACFRGGFGELELRQGLTTIVNGNCGLSAAPVLPEHAGEIAAYLTPVLGPLSGELPAASMGAYLGLLGERALPVHTGMLTGAGTLRASVAGYAAGPLTDGQLRAIRRGIERSLSDGALGVSLGLGYAPECFSSTEELCALLQPLAGTDIPVTVHMREEGSRVDEAVSEMLTVAKTLRCPVHISHLKAMGSRNWQKKIPAILALLERERASGTDISWDVYPYTAGSTQLLHIMPPELLKGGTEEICRRLTDGAYREQLKRRLAEGTDFDNISMLVGWENILMSTLSLPENARYAGKTVAEIAALRGQTPEDCVFDLLAAERCAITMIDFITCEEDISAILRSSAVNIISDSTYPTEGNPHPRLYGTFARVIEKYVLRDGVLTLPQAVHKMTQVPAQALRLDGKGILRAGADADINLFVPEKVREHGTYENPACFASGIDVILGGKPVLTDGNLLPENFCGSVLRSVQSC